MMARETTAVPPNLRTTPSAEVAGRASADDRRERGSLQAA